MKVTYLIGNGFDIQYGLKTRFTDFYDGVVQNKVNSDNIIYEDILKTHRKFADTDDPYNNWSDCEMRIGGYSKEYIPNPEKGEIHKVKEKQFVDDTYSVSGDLKLYLQAEEKQFSVKKKEECTPLFKDELSDIFSGLPTLWKNQLTQWFFSSTAPIDVNFINFNYTRVFDKILENANRSGFSLPNRNMVYLNAAVHIHGTLDEYRILGVNDRGQLSPHFSDDMARLLVKEEIQDALGEQMKADAESFIEESDLIVIFGMSLGESDKRWWELVLKRVIDANKKVLIHWFEKDYAKDNPKVSIELRDQVMDKMFSYAPNVTSEERKEIERNIYIDFNHPILLNKEWGIKELKEETEDKQ